MLCNIYYSSPENGEHLRRFINSSGVGTVASAQTLQQLPARWRKRAEVVLLEYQENNPALDSWIAHHAADPYGPAIFLYFHEMSPDHLWKTLALGVHGYFTYPYEEGEFQESLQAVPRRWQ